MPYRLATGLNGGWSYFVIPEDQTTDDRRVLRLWLAETNVEGTEVFLGGSLIGFACPNLAMAFRLRWC